MIATVTIQTAARGNSTYLKNAYCTPPFKLANITENKKANPLHLMLMSSSPGVLNGDQYQLKIGLQKDSSLQLHTQSYQRLFNMKEHASQSMEVSLADNASFIFLPHPIVPHTASFFTATNKVYLSNNCTLLWGEILTCGRKLNGEIFMFSKYHSITEIFLQQKLVVKENLLIEPAANCLSAIGQLEGFTHQASLVYLHPTVGIKPLYDMVQALLARQKEIEFGITVAPVNGLVIRILGHRAEQLHNCFKLIAGILPQDVPLKTIADAS